MINFKSYFLQLWHLCPGGRENSHKRTIINKQALTLTLWRTHFFLVQD